MKVQVYLFFILFLLVTGCTKDPLTQDEQHPKEAPPKVEEVIRLKQGNLKEYRPKVGEKRTYTNAGEEIYVHEVIAENEEFIQITVSLSGAPTTQIYRWTNEEITLVHEMAGRQDPELIQAFVPMEFPEIFMDLNGQAEWQLVQEDMTVTVPSGTYSDVIAIRKTTDEVVGADTIYTRYFSPGMGLIKETYEVTGEHGYKDEANLDRIE
jgi:hypothetical protein